MISGGLTCKLASRRMLRPGQHNALYLRLLFGLAVALLAVLPA